MDEIVKKIFPKDESLARSFDEELKKKNSGLIYLETEAGYVMYSSLSSFITKLAGNLFHFFIIPTV